MKYQCFHRCEAEARQATGMHQPECACCAECSGLLRGLLYAPVPRSGRVAGRYFLLLLLTVLATWSMVGCHRVTDPAGGAGRQGAASTGKNHPPDSSGAIQTIERGPVRVRAQVHPAVARLSDELEMTLRMEYDPQIELKPPGFVEDLGPFVVRDFLERPPRRVQDRLVLEHVYRLEPTDAGALQIDPIPVQFADQRPSGDGKWHTVQTPPLTLNVSTEVGTEALSLSDLRPPVEPIPFSQRRSWRILGLFALLPLAVALLGLVIWWRKRERALNALLLSPRERALHQLHQLQESALAATDVKEFFVQLTAIVRRYIEAVTGVSAAEQTTAEFFHAIADHPSFSVPATGRLREFLEAADLIKFAAHQPTETEVTNSLDRARAFVETIDGQPAEPRAEPIVSASADAQQELGA